jgi:integrase
VSTLVQRGADKWLIAIDHGKDPATGRRVRKWHTFKGGKREAQKEQVRLTAEAAAGLAVTADKMTVAAFLDRWLRDVKARISPKTYERYTEIAAAIALQLGAMRLDQLKPVQISTAWAKALESGRRDGKGGLAPRSVHHMHRVLKTALKWAVDMELLNRNPADKVTAPAVPKVPIETYAIADTGALIAQLRQADIHVPVFLAAMSGARRGELCALKWRNVDLKAATMTILESVEQLNNTVRIKGPKTGRGRVIALGASVVDVLRAHKAEQATILDKFGIKQGPDTLVCCHPDGSLMHPRWLSKKWHAAVKASGLPVRGFHHLRHAHATALLTSGIHPKVASERLGHSTVGITMDLYSHVLPGMQEEAAAKVDAAYKAIAAPAPATKE